MKIEFLSIIERVCKQAFKHSSILLAFKKTGISPFNPQVVLKDVEKRNAKRTPSPPPNNQDGPLSSPFQTPLTLQQINQVAYSLECVLEDDDTLDPDFAYNLSQFIHGSLVAATELVQTKRDLRRTRLAEATARARRNMQNTPLQSGGVLTVAEGRAMVAQKKEDDLVKARKIVKAAELRAHNALKRAFAAAAKEARKWRLTGRLAPAEIVESQYGKRMLKRF